MKWLSVLLCLCGFVVSSKGATVQEKGRSIQTVPISLFSRYFYTKDRDGEPLPLGPDKSWYGDPQRVGGRLIFDIYILNLSTVPQTGTVGVIPGSVVAKAETTAAGLEHNARKHLFLISGSTGNHGLPFTVGDPDDYLPTSIDFSLSASGTANSSRKLTFVMAFDTLFGKPAAGADNIWATLAAGFKIKLNEERGAVVASITPRTSPFSFSVAKGATFQYCTGCPSFYATYSGEYPDSPGVPVMVNGGRPF